MWFLLVKIGRYMDKMQLLLLLIETMNVPAESQEEIARVYLANQRVSPVIHFKMT
ncbi:MAG: hypothetical protein U5K79_16550 [Cyclobacteriaceae bacterium]|nr:hypothetical protein [Cyclobacteriaceae bacterium]